MEDSQIESHLFSASIGFWQILWIDQEKQHAPLGMAFLPQIMALTFLFIIRGEHQGGCGGFVACHEQVTRYQQHQAGFFPRTLQEGCKTITVEHG